MSAGLGAAVHVRDVHRTFGSGPSAVHALRGVDLDVEPGELDTTTAREVFDALRTANRESGTTVVVVTHDPAVSGLVERTVAIRDGRTSSEVLRRDAGGDVTHEEYAVMDRAGRLQVPREYREALALTRRVRLALEADHLAVWPDGSAR